MGGEHAADDIFVAILIEDASGDIAVHVGYGCCHVGERNTEVFHLFGREQYLIFLDLSAKDGNLCHTSCGKKARTNSPVGEGAQVAQGSGVGGEAYGHQFAENGRLRSQSWCSYSFGQKCGGCCQLF